MNRTIFLIETLRGKVYVIAKDPTSAEKMVIDTFKQWGYSFPTILSITRIAVEGQYGEPMFFLEAK